MTNDPCGEIAALLDAVAAGDAELAAGAAAHAASCARCAAALERARQLERVLRTRQPPAPPAHFTARTLARIRRDRWQREQIFDRAFNVTLAVAVLSVAAAAALFVARSGLTLIPRGTMTVIGRQAFDAVRSLAPQLPLYGAAAGLIAAALGLWWWAERDEAA